MTTEDMGHGVEKEHMGYASAQQANEYCISNAGGHCWSCKFFDQSEPLTWDQYRVEGEVHGSPAYKLDGYCRRHAPQHSLDEQGDPTALWPWVQGHDWCGEYKEDSLPEAMDRLTFDPSPQ